MKIHLLSIILVFCSFASHAQRISPEAQKVQKYMIENAVIAHRGTIYWAPELTEAAFRWARHTGADYLELDVHRSKDGVLIIMHDRSFARTTDVASKFPGRENDFIETFTFEEIMQLSAGSVFNQKHPEQARPCFEKERVLVFEDAFRIAEGKRIKRNPDGSRIFYKDANGKYTFEYEVDPADNGNRPGIYIETKAPTYYPAMEEQIYADLTRIGWNPVEDKSLTGKEPAYLKGKVNVGKTKGKILVQTFDRTGMKNFQRVFKGQVLMSLLVGNSQEDSFAKPEVMQDMVDFVLSVGAQFIGTNIGNTASDGLRPEFAKKIHDAGLKTNVYSFNTNEDMEKYFGPGKGKKAHPLMDGMITNRADLTIDFYASKNLRKIKNTQNPKQVLETLGY